MPFDYLNLFLVLLAAWSCGMVAVRLGYPSVLGELIGGIVFGPTLLGWLEMSEALRVLAEVGVLLLMLYIGMEIDPAELGRASWAGLLAALGGFVTPFALCFLAVRYFGATPMAAVIVGLAAAGTSLAMKSRILVDLKLLNTRVAHAMMAAALITDSILLIVFAGALGVAETGEINAQSISIMALRAIGFFIATALLGMFVFPWAGRWLARLGATGRTFNFSLVLIMAVGFGALAHMSGLHAVVGTFIAGVFLRDNVLGRTLSRDLMGAVHEISVGFLAPIFFVTAGFAVTRETFTTELLPLVVVVGMAIVAKIVGTVGFYLFSGNGWREGLAVATGMNGRGMVEIIIGGIALERGLITPDLFSIIVVMAIFTTITVPIALKLTTDWLRRRGELVLSQTGRSGLLMLGAGPTARLLARHLGSSQGLMMLDNNPERCELAAAAGLRVVCANALQEQALAEAGAGRCHTLITMTPNVEVNALVAQLARNVFLVPQIHVLQRGNGRSRRFRRVPETLAHLQATTLFGGPVDVVYWDRVIEAGHFRDEIVKITEPIDAERFCDQIRHEAPPSLPLALMRGGQLMPLHSGERLLAEDGVVVLHALPSAAQEDGQRQEETDSAAPVGTNGKAALRVPAGSAG